jgi:DNA-binding MarR family transcriptional regulator
MSSSKSPDAWATFLITANRVHQGMEAAMKEADLPSLEIYDVLWTLEQAPKYGLRFSDLGERVLLSRSNVTRLAERLEEQGLIERKRCPQDRRGVYAVLTPAGRKTRQDMWKVYGKLIEERFSKLLSSKDHADLIRILSKVYTSPEYDDVSCETQGK